MQTLDQFKNIENICLEAEKKAVIRENLIRFMQDNPLLHDIDRQIELINNNIYGYNELQQ